jgi:DNA-binding transcriptional ArsR family regulator
MINRIATGDAAISVLAALAQEHRLAAFRRLVEAGPEGLPAGDVAQQLDLPASSLSFHLAHLERAGLVAKTRAGRSLIYRARFDIVRALADYLLENCCGGRACAAADEPTRQPHGEAA